MDERNIEPLRGEEWPPYKLNMICATPGCTETHLEQHHIWRRSFVGGDVWWIRLPDETELANVVGLCHAHHAMVTENKAEIEAVLDLNRDLFFFYWNSPSSGTRLLSWQPPEHPLHDERYDEIPEDYWVIDNECPTCHRALPRPKIEEPTEAKRARRTWSITVPKDNREDGAETLDRLLEEIREELGKKGLIYGEGPKTRFFVLSTAMALFLTHAEEILS